MDSETLCQIYVPKWNMVNESVLDDPNVCRSVVDQLVPHGLFFQLCDMDYDQLFAEFNVGAARQTCLGAEVKMRSEHNLRERKRFERRCARQVAEATEVIHLRNKVSVIEAAEATRVTTLESVAVTKDTELASLNAQTAKLTQDLSTLELSCDELSIKAASFESQRDGLTNRDAQLKVLSDRVAGLDFELMALALHLDEEFYPRFLTTIAGWRWIIGHSLRLAVMKCRQSPKYAAAFRAVIGLAIDKEARHVSAGLSSETLELKEGALSHRLSNSDAIGTLVDPLSSENLIGEASTSKVPGKAAATTALSISVTATSANS
ncbi:hypothetical protein Tco_1519356, partial [Tanacetum coccineum]